MELQLYEIQNKIYEIRGRRIMLDFDLAEMYRVETKNLNLTVKRNMKRFPPDFMFQLTKGEWDGLRLQIETSKRGGRRYLPHVFTQEGVAMLSGLLNSDVAIGVNIIIMRAFVAIREYILAHASESVEITQLRERMLRLEQAKEQLERADEDNLEAINDLSEDIRKELDNIYNAIGALSTRPPQLDKNRRLIGFKRSNEQ